MFDNCFVISKNLPILARKVHLYLANQKDILPKNSIALKRFLPSFIGAFTHDISTACTPRLVRICQFCLVTRDAFPSMKYSIGKCISYERILCWISCKIPVSFKSRSDECDIGFRYRFFLESPKLFKQKKSRSIYVCVNVEIFNARSRKKHSSRIKSLAFKSRNSTLNTSPR